MMKSRWASALRKDRANVLLFVRFHSTRHEARQRAKAFSEPLLSKLSLRPTVVQV